MSKQVRPATKGVQQLGLKCKYFSFGFIYIINNQPFQLFYFVLPLDYFIISWIASLLSLMTSLPESVWTLYLFSQFKHKLHSISAKELPLAFASKNDERCRSATSVIQEILQIQYLWACFYVELFGAFLIISVAVRCARVQVA